MLGWPGPLFGAIIFLVFPKNHYKKLVFGGPNHSQRDPLSQAVILVRPGCSPSCFLVKNIKNIKKSHEKTLKTRSNLGPRPPGPLPSVQTPNKKKNRLNGIPNGPILKGFVTISHKIIKKSLPDRPLRGRGAAAPRPGPGPRSGRSAAAPRPFR